MGDYSINMFQKGDWVECPNNKRGMIVNWGIMKPSGRITQTSRKQAYDAMDNNPYKQFKWNGYLCIAYWNEHLQESSNIWYLIQEVKPIAVPYWTDYEYIWSSENA